MTRPQTWSSNFKPRKGKFRNGRNAGTFDTGEGKTLTAAGKLFRLHDIHHWPPPLTGKRGTLVRGKVHRGGLCFTKLNILRSGQRRSKLL